MSDDFKKVRDEIEREIGENLKAMTEWTQKRLSRVARSDAAATKEMLAQVVSFGALYSWLRDIVVEEDATRVALVDQFVEDLKKRLLTNAAAALATQVKPRG